MIPDLTDHDLTVVVLRRIFQGLLYLSRMSLVLPFCLQCQLGFQGWFQLPQEHSLLLRTGMRMLLGEVHPAYLPPCASSHCFRKVCKASCVVAVRELFCLEAFPEGLGID